MIPIHNFVLWIGRSKSIVSDQKNLCHGVAIQYSKRPKMGGLGNRNVFILGLTRAVALGGKF